MGINIRSITSSIVGIEVGDVGHASKKILFTQGLSEITNCLKNLENLKTAYAKVGITLSAFALLFTAGRNFMNSNTQKDA